MRFKNPTGVAITVAFIGATAMMTMVTGEFGIGLICGVVFAALLAVIILS